MRQSSVVFLVAVLLGVVYGAVTPITSLPFTNSGDTSTSDPVLAPCEEFTKQGDLYSFTGNGELIFATTCDEFGGSAGYDSQIYVWIDGDTTCVADADDNCGLQSYVNFVAAVGVNYIIFVSGYSSNAGVYTVVVGSSGPPPTPIPITSLPFTASGDTTTANYFASQCSDPKQGVLYSLTGTGDFVFATTCTADGGASDFDTFISVTDAEGNCVATNDDFCDFGSWLSFYAIAGEQYFIFVTGYSDNTGTYTVVVGAAEPANPTPITNTPFVASGDTTDSPVLVAPCGFATRGDLYSLIGDGGDYYATTCSGLGGGSDGDTEIYVWTPGALDCVTYGDQECGDQSYVTWLTDAGQEYWIMVNGYFEPVNYTLAVDKGNPGPPIVPSARRELESRRKRSMERRAMDKQSKNAQVAAASTTAGGLALVALACVAHALALMM